MHNVEHWTDNPLLRHNKSMDLDLMIIAFFAEILKNFLVKITKRLTLNYYRLSI